jgi:hypothetical protein
MTSSSMYFQLSAAHPKPGSERAFRAIPELRSNESHF